MPVELVGSERVNVLSPVSAREIRRLPARPVVVQLPAPLSAREHALLGRWFGGRPDATLRIYGHVPADLDFLASYGSVRSFVLSAGPRLATDLSGLAFLPGELRQLQLDVRLPPGEDLAVLRQFPTLEVLSLHGTRRLPDLDRTLSTVTTLGLGDVRGLELVARFPGVRRLRLQSVTADLSPLAALPHLEELSINLGGCADLSPLADATTLLRFTAEVVRGLTDLSAVVGLPNLVSLSLAQLRRLVELPDMSGADRLAQVGLEHLRGLRDLTPLAHAPALSRLALVEMEHLAVADLVCLVGHPTLSDVHVGLGSDRRNLAARDLLKVSGTYGAYPWP